MKCHCDCNDQFCSLKPGLTISEVACRLGLSYDIARKLCLEHGYRYPDGRSSGQNHRRKLDPAKADWKQSNIAIAREFGVSRERVRVIRKRMRRKFVESRGRRKSK